MGKVVPVDCGEGQDCGEVIEVVAKLYAVTRTQDGIQLNFGSVKSSISPSEYASYQLWLTPEEAWNLEIEPGDIYDVLFIRRDNSGDIVSNE